MEKIKKWCSALVNSCAKPTKLPLEDDGGQQSPGLVPFRYPPLGAPTHIRVLEILPGDHNSEIRFGLREKGLGDGDIYYALSYAWGPPHFTHKIYNAEGFIQVTENLWEALRRYRKADKLMILWVDAVCINQANVEERSQQIVLMRRIYSESKCVLIWLGLESPSDRLAFEYITRIIDLCRDFEDPHSMEFIDALESLRSDKDEDALTKLFEKQWFTRVWTYQEMSCATKATLASGSLECDFECLNGFCSVLIVTGPSVWLKSNAAQHAVAQICSAGLTKEYLSQRSAANSLLALVERTRNRLATDPRDKIYGVIALSSDIIPLPFAPTYEISVHHLFEEFAAHLIRQNENLDIFGWCAFQPVLREWPSWVPDWRCLEGVTVPVNPKEQSFHAAGKTCWDTSTVIINHSLGVDAICLDRLQNITSPGPSPNFFGLTDWETTYLPIFKWRQNVIRETMEMTSLSVLYRSEKERWQAWWQTFIGERSNDFERATPDYETRVRSFIEAIDSIISEDLDVEIDRINEHYSIELCMGRMTHNRRFCLTLKGCIGWVPLAARTGDIVSLMRGSPVPVIIRPVQRENLYLMIGQCYIHGIMDGEAVAGKEDQFRRIQLV